MTTGTALALFGSAMLVAAVLVPLLRRWALRKALLDHPNERSSHTVPTPRGGGLAIVAVTLAGCIPWLTPRLAVFALTALAIAVVSWIDDLRDLSPVLRLAAQIAAAGVIVYAFGGGPAGAVIALPWIVGLTNAYNFMDGIDGIAGGQAVIAGLAWGWLGFVAGQPAIAAFGLLIAGSSAGFLLHNWQPATIFMGDVGSAFLGFTFASLAVIASQSKPELFEAGVLVVWPFAADAAFTFLRRARRRERLLHAHKSHVYQRLHQTGVAHAPVTLIYIGLAAAGAGGAVARLRGVPLPWIAAALAALAAGVWALTVVRERKPVA